MGDKALENGVFADQPKVILPKCQQCGEDPANITASFITLGKLEALVFHCGAPHCRAIYSVAVMGMNGQSPVLPAGSRLVIPPQ